ncbi:MAG TPA: sigma-54 dependent transcriptional regulator [Candidatus Acidoferrales bacterium]|nr:sigma-54 dependent transcriptional regulator [Candidatus Acidoferrales bacterium]
MLVINEDEALARFLSNYLVRREFEISTASGGDEAIRVFRVYDPALVLLDLMMKGTSGLETLERLKQVKPDISVIVISAMQQPELIFRASKLGADDFVAKPFDPKDLDVRIHKLLEKQRLSSEVTQLRDQVRRQTDFTMLFGTSPKMEDVKNTIEQVADTNATVLIRGESGTGKEVVARMIYSQSGRHDKPFVKVNCAAIPHELLESELFGYEAGAFTGANRQKLGKFELANTGTLFLDEVSEMHPALQAKLLHVLQDGEFSRLGGKRDVAVDVRVLAATNKQLERAVEEGMFREDLFYRLNVITVHIPPLRERREEIPIFLDFFLRKYSDYYGKQPGPFTDYAVNRMIEYNWPGNIRELENLVKRYVIVGNESQIIRELSTHKPLISSISNGASQWPTKEKPAPVEVARSGSSGGNGGTIPMSNPSGDAEMPSLLEIGRRAAMQAEREAIERVLTQTRWNRRQAAKILKISYKALLNKLKLMEESSGSSNKSQIA